MKGEHVVRIASLLLTMVALGLVISVYRDVQDISAPDAPRAFFKAKVLDSVPLKPVQSILFCFEVVLCILLVLQGIRGSQYTQVVELEHAPLANFCISQIFLFLIKAIGLIILIAFLVFTSQDVSKVRIDYEYLIEQE